MQTIYYQTNSFIRHEGNVVDLGTYRQKLAAVSGEDWAAQAVEDAPLFAPAAVDGPVLTLVPPALRAERKRRRHIRRFGLFLDLCASLAIVVLTTAAVIQFIRL